MRRTIINSAAMWAISLCCFSCNQENEGTASPTTQSDNSIASDIKAGKQDQQEKKSNLSAEWAATKARIKAAVVALGSRTHDDANVTIEDLVSGKGFQFIKRPGHPVSLLLFMSRFDVEESKRAKLYFGELGISDTDDYAVFEGFQAYEVDFDNNYEGATNIAIDIYIKIYQFTENFDIVISEY